VDLVPGQPAPTAGRLLDDEAIAKLVQVLREGDDAKALAETLRAALEAVRAESAELRAALAGAKAENAANREALIRADERDKLRAESIGLLKDALAEYRAALSEARQEIREQRTQASRDRLLSALPLIGTFLILFGFAR